jgi:hypothetical protein
LTNLLYKNFLESNKTSLPTIKVLYVDSEGNFSPSYFNKITKGKIKKILNSNTISKETAIELNKFFENSIYLYKIFSVKDMSELLETELLKILNLDKMEYNVNFLRIFISSLK